MKGMRKISRGNGFRGVLSYAFLRDEDHLAQPGLMIGGNMSGSTPVELSKEFSLARQLRPSIKKPVWHNSLRLPAGESISDEHWRVISDDYMDAMGFTELHQRVVIMHNDNDGHHVHIIASRISLTGELWLGQNENLISTKVIAQLERKHRLTITKGVNYDSDKNIVMPENSSLKKGEIEKALITGQQPSKLVLQELITNASKRKPNIIEFIRQLEAQSVTVVPNIASTGRMNGFSFEYAGIAFSGASLGNKYKWSTLQKVIDYEQNRDSKELAARCSRSRNIGITVEHKGFDIHDTRDNSSNTSTFSSTDANCADEHGDDRASQPSLIKTKVAFAGSGTSYTVHPAPTQKHRISSASPARRERRDSRDANIVERDLGEIESDSSEIKSRRGAINLDKLGLPSYPNPKYAIYIRLRKSKNAIVNGSDATYKRKNYRPKMLESTYGRTSELLTQFWHIDKSYFGIVFSNRAGRIIDRGTSIHCDKGNAKEIEAMIEVAKMKGWTSLTILGGTEDFKYRAMMKSLHSGFKIVANSTEDKKILQKVVDAIADIGTLGSSRILELTAVDHATRREKQKSPSWSSNSVLRKRTNRL